MVSHIRATSVRRTSANVCVYSLLWCSIAWRVGHGGTRYVDPGDCAWEPALGSEPWLSATSSSSPLSSSSLAIAITCSVVKLENRGDPGGINFSSAIMMSEHAVQLTVRCDDLLLPSELANGSFGRLPALRSLSIERCKLHTVPPLAFEGLRNLSRLVLRTFNADRGHFVLRLASTSFAPLKAVESLDLSENNMESFPRRALCGLEQLRVVNMSRNAFANVFNIGFADDHCTATVRELEVAHNRVKVLPERAFVSLVQLEMLRLDHNHLIRAEPSALVGLSNLRTLDMAHNVLADLPEALFRPTARLAELYLRNNSLRTLPTRLFGGLQDLTVLDLAFNQFATLDWLRGSGEPGGLLRLATLDLSYNRLSHLSSYDFQALTNLQTLQLEHNIIKQVADNAFKTLNRLHTLVLSHNRLKFISVLSMTDPSSLMALQLDHNQLESVGPHSFDGLPLLQELNLASNRLTSVPEAVSSLSMLRSLDLSDNRIRHVSNASYRGLEQLYALNLMGNRITSISQAAFAQLPQVRVLNLACNQISAVELTTFDDIPGLHYLRVDSNAIDDINGLFGNLHDLIMLNVSANRVRWFDYGFIPLSLQWLDIHDNRIEALGNRFGVEHSLKLRTLDASFNKLTSLNSSSLPAGIEIAFLNDNSLRSVEPFTFLGRPNLTRVSLANNRLTTLEMTAFRISREVQRDLGRRPLAEFAIGGNPFVCDCHMEWLRKLLLNAPHLEPNDSSNEASSTGRGGGDADGEYRSSSSSKPRRYPRVTDPHSVECVVPLLIDSKQGSTVRAEVRDAADAQSAPDAVLATFATAHTFPLVSLKPTQFLCVYHRHCFSLCHCCDFRACDCEMVCPAGCECYRDRSWSVNIVDCGRRRRVDVPDRLPSGLEAAASLYLDGNDLVTLGQHSFGQYRGAVSGSSSSGNTLVGSNANVTRLYLNASNIVTLGSGTFVGLQAGLRVLRLDDNRLFALHGHEFDGLAGLTELYLSNNQLNYVSNATFDQLTSLATLHLDRNYLVELAVLALRRNTNLVDVRLAQNPWTCECRFALQLARFVRARGPQAVRDLGQLTCVFNDTHTLHFWQQQQQQQNQQWQHDQQQQRQQQQQNITVTTTTQSLAGVECRSTNIDGSPSPVLHQFYLYGLESVWPLFFDGSSIVVVVVVIVFGLVVVVVVIVISVIAVAASTPIACTSLGCLRRHLGSWLPFTQYCGMSVFQRASAFDAPADATAAADDDTKLFDAFVSYSKRDEAFVAQLLVPGLECSTHSRGDSSSSSNLNGNINGNSNSSNPRYRLCLLYRELATIAAGDGCYLSGAIREAIESSSRTIVVLSEHALRSQWCRYEFKAAHEHALTSKRHRLIVILVGRLSYRQLDPEMRAWLKQSTFIHWGEKRFWDRLHRLMPDLRHRKVDRSMLSSVSVHI